MLRSGVPTSPVLYAKVVTQPRLFRVRTCLPRFPAVLSNSTYALSPRNRRQTVALTRYNVSGRSYAGVTTKIGLLLLTRANIRVLPSAPTHNLRVELR